MAFNRRPCWRLEEQRAHCNRVLFIDWSDCHADGMAELIYRMTRTSPSRPTNCEFLNSNPRLTHRRINHGALADLVDLRRFAIFQHTRFAWMLED